MLLLYRVLCWLLYWHLYWLLYWLLCARADVILFWRRRGVHPQNYRPDFVTNGYQGKHVSDGESFFRFSSPGLARNSHGDLPALARGVMSDDDTFCICRLSRISQGYGRQAKRYLLVEKHSARISLEGIPRYISYQGECHWTYHAWGMSKWG